MASLKDVMVGVGQTISEVRWVRVLDTKVPAWKLDMTLRDINRCCSSSMRRRFEECFVGGAHEVRLSGALAVFYYENYNGRIPKMAASAESSWDKKIGDLLDRLYPV